MIKVKKSESIIYQTLQNSIPESFAYLYTGMWTEGIIGEDRKNVGLLIKAFWETFKNIKNPPCLILKTTLMGSSYIDREEIIKKNKSN